MYYSHRNKYHCPNLLYFSICASVCPRVRVCMRACVFACVLLYDGKKKSLCLPLPLYIKYIIYLYIFYNYIMCCEFLQLGQG